LTDPAHQFSPAFLYNQLQYYDEGSTFEDNLTLLADQGCATLDSIPYNDEDYRTWPGASAYREGIPYRALSYDYLGHGETESIFDAVKAIIASCDVCAVGFPIYRPDPYSPGAFDLVSSADPNYDLPPASDVYLAGYHAVTIVGYDESKFEGTGGYKIVNSWGTAWGDSGFAWLSERFLTTYGFDFYSMTDRIGYSPTSFVHFKVSHPYWWYDNIIVTIGVGSTSTPIWFKILNKRLNRDALIMDRWADITEGEGHLPPTGIKPWWLKIEDHSWDDIGIISIADITSNLTTETSKISLPINCNDNANTFIYFTDKERALFLVSPAATTYQYTCPLGWRCYGYGWQPNDTLCAEYSSDGGATWNAISGAAALPYHSLSYTWDIIKMPYGSNYKARYTCNQDPLTVATMSGTFTIGDLTRYFVNDASQADDVYCIALGNDANDGLTSATPKATVQAILATYDLEPGDTIFVDSGTYNLTADIVVGAADGGAAAGQVRIVGVKGKTILDRGAPVVSGQANMCVQVIADYVSLENLTCRNANFGIYLAIGSDYCVVEDNRIFGCPGNGIYAYLASYSVIQRNIVTQVDSGSAILLNDYFSYRSLTVPCEVKNNIFVSSNANGICVGVSKGPVLKNNIVLASGTGKFCVSTYDALAIEASDYNDLFPSGGAKVGNIYQYEASTLDEWQSAIGWDIHSISADPMFVDPDGPDNIAGNADDDYHLKSTEGRWDPAANGGVGGWVKDDVNSPCIDAGNPADSFTLEPSPNGGRINIGAYGGTAEASKSPASGRWLVFEGAGNREPLHAWEPLHWTARGANWRLARRCDLRSATILERHGCQSLMRRTSPMMRCSIGGILGPFQMTTIIVSASWQTLETR